MAPISQRACDQVIITLRESLVGLYHSPEVPQFPTIVEPRLLHTAEPRILYIEEAEHRLPLTAEQY